MKQISALIFLMGMSTLVINGQSSDVRMYAFGHSLIDHATSFEETNIMYWINDISQVAGNSFATGGQYGFLTSHDDLPPSSNWWYNGIEGVWDSEEEPFPDADVNTILLTAANFIQDVNSNDPHPLESSTTVVQSTETIFDWVNTQESNVKYYIYENWPEMDLQSAYPPTLPEQSEIDDYHNLTINSFTAWWTEYQDKMLISRPQLNTRLIPVGMIISKILRDIVPNQIPFDSLYEDSAPHGKPTIYFLAGMITYMAIFEENIPNDYIPNSAVHSVIIDNLSVIRDFIWNELLGFNNQNGDNRVFCPEIINATDEFNDIQSIVLSPNPAANYFEIVNLKNHNIKIDIYNCTGNIIKTIDNNDVNEKINIEGFQNGIYFIYIQGKVNVVEKLIIRR